MSEQRWKGYQGSEQQAKRVLTTTQTGWDAVVLRDNLEIPKGTRGRILYAGVPGCVLLRLQGYDTASRWIDFSLGSRTNVRLPYSEVQILTKYGYRYCEEFVPYKPMQGFPSWETEANSDLTKAAQEVIAQIKDPGPEAPQLQRLAYTQEVYDALELVVMARKHLTRVRKQDKLGVLFPGITLRRI